MTDTDSGPVAINMPRLTRPLFKTFDVGMAKALFRPQVDVSKGVKSDAPSGQRANVGVRQHPFNMHVVDGLIDANEHHSTCVRTKVNATVGLGFESEADRGRKEAKRQALPEPTFEPAQEISVVDRTLNPLCDHTWESVLRAVAEDYWTKGNGYIEVVRESSAENAAITGLHHLPAKDTYLVLEDERGANSFWQVWGESVAQLAFARFGEAGREIRNSAIFTTFPGFSQQGEGNGDGTVSEVIHIARPSARDRWYGYPDWLSATASIEMTQMLKQYEFDFFLNRAVPEFMLFLLGANLIEEDRKKIEQAMARTVGLQNQYKSLLVTLNNPDIRVQLEKLGLDSDGGNSDYSSRVETNALSIVTAHGVPPLLAGIQIPGKLGASNEMVQAMVAFQALVIAPAQNVFVQTLRSTLGDPECNGGLELAPEDFVLNTITDEIDVDRMDTVARMRQSPQQAAAEGRDLDRGVRD